MAIIYVGIDGTGEGDWEEYAKEMFNSFVQRLWTRWEWHGHRHYLRGPTTSGSQTKYLSNEAVKWVNWSIKHGTPPLGVFLSGYSRGGAALIDAAKTLKTLGINVECLLLFDAVDRTNTLNAEAIPSNVKICYHSRRHPNTSSRDTFGNCGLKVANGGKTTYKEQIFFCTHGGLGGAPYTKGKPKEFIREPYSALETNVTFAKDQATSQQVWNWMWANCQREGMSQ